MNIPFYIRSTAAGSFFKNLFRSGTDFSKFVLHRKWFLENCSAPELIFEKLFCAGTGFQKIVLFRNCFSKIFWPAAPISNAYISFLVLHPHSIFFSGLRPTNFYANVASGRLQLVPGGFAYCPCLAVCDSAAPVVLIIQYIAFI